MSSSRMLRSSLRLFASWPSSRVIAVPRSACRRRRRPRRAKAQSARPPTTRDCKTDKDCVRSPTTAVRAARAARQRAIPKKQKDAYEKDRKKRCADTACTEMMSTDPTCTQEPFCGAGHLRAGRSAGRGAEVRRRAEDGRQAEGGRQAEVGRQGQVERQAEGRATRPSPATSRRAVSSSESGRRQRPCTDVAAADRGRSRRDRHGADDRRAGDGRGAAGCLQLRVDPVELGLVVDVGRTADRAGRSRAVCTAGG